MPTYESLERFLRDFAKLTPQQRALFLRAVQEFVEDLRNGRRFRPGLRVKRVQGADGVWEMTWAPDGRATWQFGDEVKPGDVHIIWRRVGTHDIFRDA